ncbi:MAG TPA: hypothetical protein VGL24_01810 [Chthoniobacterales bacterium]|jgi:hypothetical protein
MPPAKFYKAVVDFSKYIDGNLSAPAHEIYDNMLLSALIFSEPPVTMAAFLVLVTAWDHALGESLKGGTDRTTLKNDARRDLEDALGRLGGYVNLVADGDRAKINLSGFPSYSTEHVQSSGGVTFVPQDVRWEDGTLSATAILRWKGDGKGSTYEVQSCIGDPTVEGNWTYRGSFTGGRAELDGFVPGTVIWGRARKIGTRGAVGGWSDPAQTRVK